MVFDHVVEFDIDVGDGEVSGHVGSILGTGMRTWVERGIDSDVGGGFRGPHEIPLDTVTLSVVVLEDK